MNLVKEISRVKRILKRQLAQMTVEEGNEYLDFLKVGIKKHIDNVELTPAETSLYDRYMLLIAVGTAGESTLSPASANSPGELESSSSITARPLDQTGFTEAVITDGRKPPAMPVPPI